MATAGCGAETTAARSSASRYEIAEVIAASCSEGDLEQDTVCAKGRGTGSRLCVDGSWRVESCSCTEDPETYDRLADTCRVRVSCDSSAQPFGGGDGETTPFTICSRQHLENVSTQPSARFLLARSMNLTRYEDFTPLGGGEHGHFEGEFDGGGHVLIGLSIDRGSGALGSPEDHVGLFRRLTGGSVKNLELRDFLVRGRNYVGPLAGSATQASVEKVVVTGGSVEGEANYIGGLVGRTDDGRVSRSVSSANVTGEGAVGGLVGFAYAGLFERCRAHGAVTAFMEEAGGLLGDSADHVVQECAATGAVSAPSHAGGLVGHMSGDDAIIRSFATGPVDGDRNIGGLTGTTNGYSGTIEASYATGDVTATGASVGGLVGSADITMVDDGFTISDSYAFGTVEWTGPQPPLESIGALVGYSNMTKQRSPAREHEPELPLVGELGPNGSSVDSELLSPCEFSNEASFPGWDFETVWQMSRERGRPVLRWETEQ